MWAWVFPFLFGIFGDETPKYEILKTDAPIGEIYFIHDDEATRTTAELIYPVGEADMSGPEGIAHYVEHLVAWSALPDENKDAGRDFNASTTKIFTNYYMTSDEIDDVLAYLSATAMPIDLDHQYMVEEANIVKNEFQLRFAEDPYVPLWEELQNAVFQGTGLARSIIGEQGAIVNFAPETAIDIHDKFYRLPDARLVIISPLSAKDVKNAINHAFANSPNSSSIERPLLDENPIYEGIDADEIVDPKIRSTIYQSDLVSPFPTQYDDLQIELYMRFANDILQSNKAGMLSRQLEFDDKLFSNLGFGFYRLPAEMGIQLDLYAQPKTGKSPDALSAYYLNWIDEISANPENIAEIIEQGQENFMRDLENWTAEDEYEFIRFQIYQNPVRPFSFEDIAKAAQKVTAEEVVEFMNVLAQQNHITNRIWKGPNS